MSMAHHVDEAVALTPVTVLTGFLGSGKTTIINTLVTDPQFADTLVIVNEFGAVGLDHLLYLVPDGDMVVELSDGCVCCSLQGDLARALVQAHDRVRRNGGARFSRVIIETTGVADPVPIVQALLADPLLLGRYRLTGVVTTVDAATALRSLAGQPECETQIALADRLLLTKTDLVDEEGLAQVMRALDALNASASRMTVLHGQVEPSMLFEQCRDDTDVMPLWMDDVAMVLEDAPPLIGIAAAQPPVIQPVDAGSHAERYRSFSFLADVPVSRRDFDLWLSVVLGMFGDRVLRFKALLAVEDSERPLAIHAVRDVFHPAVEMPARPDSDRSSRLVFITQDLPASVVEASLASFLPDRFRLFASSTPPTNGARSMSACGMLLFDNN